MLEAVGVEKRYGEVVALRGVDLAVEAGSVVALLGRNGAGKTTLLSIVAGLLQADAGSVTVDGVDALADPVGASRSIGIAPQQTGIYRAVSVRENLEFFGALVGIGRRERRRRAEEVAEQLGLADLLGRVAKTLSGGEARRLHTACALVHRPRLLLLDEPTVGADVGTRNQLIDAVRGLAADGAAIVYTTHYLPEVEALAADIVVIDDGLILARGRQSELTDRYRIDGVDVRIDRDLPPAETLAGYRASYRGDRRWRLETTDSVVAVSAAVGALGVGLVSVEAIRPDLEQVFLNITGSALDADEAEPDTAVPS